MSKLEKSISRLLAKPSDFRWGELKTLMAALGYDMKTTGGSGRKFTKAGTASSFLVHEPHPQSILKAYQVREFIAFLKQEGQIK